MTKRVWLGTVAVGILAALGVACSSAPGSSGSTEEIGSSHLALTLPPNCIESDIPTGTELAGDVPSTFAETCDLDHADGRFEEYAPPTFVVRLRDCRNAIYYTNGDGYMLPFPTPWISDENGQGCLDTHGNCRSDPGPFHFERAIQPPTVVGLVNHQFTIKNLTLTGHSKSPYTLAAGAESRFYNGTENTQQLDAMTGVTTDPKWTQLYTGVTPYARTCTYVLDYDSQTHSLSYSGYHSEVGEGHDPIDWPN